MHIPKRELLRKKNQNAEYTVYKIYKVHYQIFNKEEKLFTIFEACGNFYQLSWVHFGVAGFQSLILKISKIFLLTLIMSLCNKNMDEHENL